MSRELPPVAHERSLQYYGQAFAPLTIFLLTPDLAAKPDAFRLSSAAGVDRTEDMTEYGMAKATNDARATDLVAAERRLHPAKGHLAPAANDQNATVVQADLEYLVA